MSFSLFPSAFSLFKNIGLLITAALIARAAISLSGLRSGDTPLQEAALAWDRGDYSTALKIYLQILDSPDAASSIEPIALQTGELFRTTELTDDGESPSFSPDGKTVAYETGAGLRRMTKIIRVEGAAAPTVVAELPGFAASFSIDGTRVAYLAHPPVRRQRRHRPRSTARLLPNGHSDSLPSTKSSAPKPGRRP